MARQPRLDLPGVPQQIVQCGNNLHPYFLDEADRARYLHLMGEALLATGCRLHAYMLMDNHVHLLATPPDVGAVARLIQRVGRQYVDQFKPATGAAEPCGKAATRRAEAWTATEAMTSHCSSARSTVQRA